MRILALLLLAACSSIMPQQQLDPKVLYRKDMNIMVNGIQYNGTGVVPRASSYNIKIKTIGRNDVLTMTTCHQETELRAGSTEVSFTWVPRNDLENGIDSCTADFGGFDKDKGRHSWGMLDFENPAYTILGYMDCNGDTYNANGIGLCQSLAGLKQRIKFQIPVQISPSVGCKMLTPEDGKTFVYEIVQGKCTYEFFDPAANRRFRLTTFGYQQILIKQD